MSELTPQEEELQGRIELEQALEEARARIEDLEELLRLNGLPTERTTCRCCGESYMPRIHDSVRCLACCMSCHTDKPYSWNWIRGKNCPLVRKGQP